MMKEYKPTDDNYQDDENMNWLQVLAFGGEVVREI